MKHVTGIRKLVGGLNHSSIPIIYSPYMTTITKFVTTTQKAGFLGHTSSGDPAFVIGLVQMQCAADRGGHQLGSLHAVRNQI